MRTPTHRFETLRFHTQAKWNAFPTWLRLGVATLTATALVVTAVVVSPTRTAHPSTASQPATAQRSAERTTSERAPLALPSAGTSAPAIALALTNTAANDTGIVADAILGVETEDSISITTLTGRILATPPAGSAPAVQPDPSSTPVPSASPDPTAASEPSAASNPSASPDPTVAPEPSVSTESSDDVTPESPAVAGSSAPATAEGTDVSATISVSRDASEGITIDHSNGDSFGIGMPNADQASTGTRLDNGAIAYPSTGLSANAIVPTRDGVQLLTTILGPDAPTRYRYDVTIPDGAHLELLNLGAQVVDENGNVIIVVQAPWATDANGVDVPTHFEIEDGGLVQVIEHTSVDGVAYPVVADPWIWDLFVTIVSVVVSIVVTLVTGSAMLGSAVGSCAKWSLITMFDDDPSVDRFKDCMSAATYSVIGGAFGGIFGNLIGGCLTNVIWDAKGNPLAACGTGVAWGGFYAAVDKIAGSTTAREQFFNGLLGTAGNLIYKAAMTNEAKNTATGVVEFLEKQNIAQADAVKRGLAQSASDREWVGEWSYRLAQSDPIYGPKTGENCSPLVTLRLRGKCAVTYAWVEYVKRPWFAYDGRSGSPFRGPLQVGLALNELYNTGKIDGERISWVLDQIRWQRAPRYMSGNPVAADVRDYDVVYAVLAANTPLINDLRNRIVNPNLPMPHY